jgi:hypothetical protein
MSEITAARDGAGVTLADLERLGWHLSGWSVEQRALDEFLAAVEAYARGEVTRALALRSEKGPGEAQTPRGPSADLVAVGEATEALAAPQTAAQSIPPRIEVTGTLTLVCSCTGTPPVSGEVKRCAKCGNRKPVEAFSRDAKGEGGRRYACRDCENRRKRESRLAQRKAA